MRLTNAAWAEIAAAITPETLRRRSRRPDPARELIERHMRDAVAYELRRQAEWMRQQAHTDRSDEARFIALGIRMAADSLTESATTFESYGEPIQEHQTETATTVRTAQKEDSDE